MQPPGADIFSFLIHHGGNPGNLFNGIILKHKPDLLGFHQGDILFDKRILRLGQYAYKIIAAQRIEFNPDRKTTLQLRDQVRGLGNIKST